MGAAEVDRQGHVARALQPALQPQRQRLTVLQSLLHSPPCACPHAKEGRGLRHTSTRSPLGRLSLASCVHLYCAQEGGNAVDGAIATALCLGVLNPGGSGIGGQARFAQATKLQE